MGDAKRRMEYLEDAAKLLHGQEKDAQPLPCRCSRCPKEELRVIGTACECGGTFLQLPPPPPPLVLQVQRMREPARLAIFNIELLMQLVGGMASQIAIAGGQDLAQGLLQFIPLLQQLHSKVMQVEGSGIVIVGPGDVPQ
jgi:hypothetical protein